MLSAPPVSGARSYTPAVSASSGAITTLGTCTGTYYDIGPFRFVEVDVTITNNGTGAGGLNISLPSTPVAGSVAIAEGVEVGITNKHVYGVQQVANLLCFLTSTTGYPGANAARMKMLCIYRTR